MGALAYPLCRMVQADVNHLQAVVTQLTVLMSLNVLGSIPAADSTVPKS